VDFGTTTVSAVLVILSDGAFSLQGESAGNGQIRYGADVINRIVRAAKPGRHRKAQEGHHRGGNAAALIDTLCGQCRHLKKAHFPNGAASNTTLNHLLLGINADYCEGSRMCRPFSTPGRILTSALGL
jgi:uncharacterized 2Fe-2S/4Fe-4S cluster protein (DUF4445 family)